MSTAASRLNLSRMQTAQQGIMLDTCNIYRHQADNTDVYGMPDPSYVAGLPIDCGVERKSMAEMMELAHVPTNGALIRLPYGTEIDPKDRLLLTHKYKVELTDPELYEVIGPHNEGPSGIVIIAQLVSSADVGEDFSGARRD